MFVSFLYYFLIISFRGKLNTLKTASSLYIELKVPPWDRRYRMLIPSLQRNQLSNSKSIFCKLVLSLWFSMIFQNKLW